MGNSLEQWRASIGLFNSKNVIKQRVMVKVSMAFIFYYMSCLLKWAACSCKLLSNVFNDIVRNLFFKIVLILLLLEAGVCCFLKLTVHLLGACFIDTNVCFL